MTNVVLSTHWRGPTPLKRACPTFDFISCRTGLNLDGDEAFQSSGSRACCFQRARVLRLCTIGRSLGSSGTIRVAFRKYVSRLASWLTRFLEAQSPTHICLA